MRALKNFFLRGLIVMIPVVLLVLALKELVELLIAAAEPITQLFPEGAFDWVQIPALVAPVLIVVFAIFLGALASTPVIRHAGHVLESNTLGKLPLYRMIKTFVAAFLEVEDPSSFRPALILQNDGGAEPCYIIEHIPDSNQYVVMCPWSPASFAGSVKLIPEDRIKRLNTTFDEFSLVLANFGLGMKDVMNPPDDATGQLPEDTRDS